MLKVAIIGAGGVIFAQKMVCDLLLDYSLWSTAAFAIGLQLGLSLTNRPGSKT